MLLSCLLLIFAFMLNASESCQKLPRGKRNPCDDLRCGPGEECILSDQDGVLSGRCSCPSRCDDYGDSVDSSPVCSNDGDDYSSLCHLRMAACQTARNITLKFFGKCDPCADHPCPTGTQCKLEGGGSRRPVCRCSRQCSFDDDPVCASDGKSYQNECLMAVSGCRSDTDLVVYKRGRCDESSPCWSHRCHWGQTCAIETANATARCECTMQCPQVMRPVCGMDDRTYDSECELLREACIHRRRNHMKHEGACGSSLCASVACPPQQVCTMSAKGQPRCTCPECPEDYSPVCASDGRTYASECRMRHASCAHGGDPLYVRYNNECAGCTALRCQTFYSECVSDVRGVAACQCPVCPPNANNATFGAEAVCGTNSVTYSSLCHLQAASCRSGVFIAPAFTGKCDSCAATDCGYGEECERGRCTCAYDCDQAVREEVCGDDGILYPSRCHLAMAACQKRKPIHIVPLIACHQRRKEVEAGRIKDDCSCNTLGSYGPACDAHGQCRCKPGVDGKACDHCLQGFWGIHLMAKGRTSCTPCGCSVYGSSRPDCEQTTGICQCKPGVRGDKCDRCESVDDILTAAGCIPRKDFESRTSCASHPCLHGASCEGIGRPHCVCAQLNISRLATCEGHGYGTQASTMQVCGSDGVTYDNICHLERKACERQADLVAVSLGICSESATASPTLDNRPYRGGPTEQSVVDGAGLGLGLGTTRPPIAIGALCENDEECAEIIPLSTCLARTGRRPVCECSAAARHVGERCEPISHEIINRRLSDNAYRWDGRISTTRPNITMTIRLSSITDGVVLQLLSGDGRDDLVVAVQSAKLIIRIGQHKLKSSCVLSTVDPTTIGLHFHGRLARLVVQNQETSSALSTNEERIKEVAFGGTRNKLRSADACLLTASFNGAPVTAHSLQGLPGETCEAFEARRRQEASRPSLFSVLSAVDLSHPTALLTWSKLKMEVRNEIAIEMSIKPSSPDGLLFFWGRPVDPTDPASSKTTADFLALVLIAWQPTFFWNLGSGIAYVKASTLPSHRWSTVTFGRQLQNGTIRVDSGETFTAQSQGKLVHLDISGDSLYVGGLPPPLELPHRLKSLSSPYAGGLSYMTINERFFSLGQRQHWSTTVRASKEAPCDRDGHCGPHGICQIRGNEATCKCSEKTSGERCERDEAQDGAFFEDGRTADYAYLNNVNRSTDSSSRMNFTFSLKTFSTDGHLWWETGANDYFLLFLRNGLVHLAVNLGNDTPLKPVRIRGRRVNDGRWHTVDVVREERRTVVRVDDDQPLTVVSSPGSSELNANGIVYIGGRQDKKHARFALPSLFVGCVRGVRINGQRLDVRMDSISTTVPGVCRA